MRHAEITSLRKRVAHLEAGKARLEAEVADLREQLAGAIESLEGEFGPSSVEPEGKSADRLALEDLTRNLIAQGAPYDPWPGKGGIYHPPPPLTIRPGDIVTLRGSDRHRVESVDAKTGIIVVQCTRWCLDRFADVGERRQYPHTSLTLVSRP